MDLSNTLIALRKEKGLSQVDIAEKLFVSRQAVSKWEKGLSVPDVDNIVKLSEIFGVTTDYLLIGNNNNSDDVKNNKDNQNNKTESIVSKLLNKNYILIFTGIILILLIIVLSFFIPAQIKVYDVVTPSIIGEYAEIQNEIFQTVETVYHYEEITGNVIYFINTYYLHGLVFLALIFIFYGFIGVKRRKKYV